VNAFQSSVPIGSGIQVTTRSTARLSRMTSRSRSTGQAAIRTPSASGLSLGGQQTGKYIYRFEGVNIQYMEPRKTRSARGTGSGGGTKTKRSRAQPPRLSISRALAITK